MLSGLYRSRSLATVALRSLLASPAFLLRYSRTVPAYSGTRSTWPLCNAGSTTSRLPSLSFMVTLTPAFFNTSAYMLARISLSPKLNEATVSDSLLVLAPPPELHAVTNRATAASIAPATPLRCNRMGFESSLCSLAGRS